MFRPEAGLAQRAYCVWSPQFLIWSYPFLRRDQPSSTVNNCVPLLLPFPRPHPHLHSLLLSLPRSFSLLTYSSHCCLSLATFSTFVSTRTILIPLNGPTVTNACLTFLSLILDFLEVIWASFVGPLLQLAHWINTHSFWWRLGIGNHVYKSNLHCRVCSHRCTNQHCFARLRNSQDFHPGCEVLHRRWGPVLHQRQVPPYPRYFRC